MSIPSARQFTSTLDKTSFSPLHSHEYRTNLVARYTHALYRWYVARSQQTRNWNPDRGFDWRALRQNPSERLTQILEGFYAVEQYAPDYTAQLITLARKSYGRAQFQIRWGSEEEKHSDLWRNTLLFSRARTPKQLEDYTRDLRENAWEAPFQSPLEMLFYTVFQERATQLIYLKTGAIARGENPSFPGEADPVLAKVISAIAIDEAAHYDFFLEVARLHIYYFPDEALRALVTVMKNFVMPATKLYPNYDAFITVLYEAQIFSPRLFARDVAKPAMAALGVDTIRAVEAGIIRSRETPDAGGMFRPDKAFTGCNLGIVESAVQNLFGRIERFENEVGLSDIMPTTFEPWGDVLTIPDEAKPAGA
ncbi:acyl-ACP desaturase [Zavarzinella formosa]|uniref:acyl-ACP desaturase n=1 Tax=Zavarzinella formosa TaxID=360055 RepID=UPI00031F7056|nr:acyl-ACP desaturase [Zavarzinella formosa]